VGPQQYHMSGQSRLRDTVQGEDTEGGKHDAEEQGGGDRGKGEGGGGGGARVETKLNDTKLQAVSRARRA